MMEMVQTWWFELGVCTIDPYYGEISRKDPLWADHGDVDPATGWQASGQLSLCELADMADMADMAMEMTWVFSLKIVIF